MGIVKGLLSARREMDSFDLLACHMAGDYLTQTPTMVRYKLEDWAVRADHVVNYTGCFLLPVLFAPVSKKRKILFLAALAGAHFATDSKRWRLGGDENDHIRPILIDQALHALQLQLLGRLVTTR